MVSRVAQVVAPRQSHYGSEHQEFDGICLPTKRHVHLLDADGAMIPEPVVVTIDLHDVRFE